jgi:hypothetical protein
LVLLESSAAVSAEFQPVPFDTHHVEKVVKQGLCRCKRRVLPPRPVLTDDLAFRFHDRWQKEEIFHVTACGLDALSQMLDHIVAQFAAQFKGIVLENGTNYLSFQQLKSQNYLSLIHKHKKFNQFTNSLSGPTHTLLLLRICFLFHLLEERSRCW